MSAAPDSTVPPAHQSVRAESGFAYGVIGADLHVLGNGMPLYLLGKWSPAAPAPTQWLRELPSRMLNARNAVVGFSGRHDERRSLHAWLAEDARLSMRWLHGVGGQGKTRLADQLALEAGAGGWQTVVATHGPGAVVRSASHDLRSNGHTGLLIIVDYADRWPLSHLNWLFSNSLLRQPGLPVRVLLLARTDDAWLPVAEAAAEQGAATSRQRLDPLPATVAARTEMFSAARDGFAQHYGLADPPTVVPAVSLDSPGMGLTLALHVAALVAVDAHVSGRRAPADMAGLTVYLLDREHAHWSRMADDGTHHVGATGGALRTPPEVMNHTVFVASLTGPQTHDRGMAVLRGSGIHDASDRADQILADHALCYPAAQPGDGTVLEPLYPDRLAEDFLALTLPGHSVTDYPAQAWAASTSRLLTVRDEEGSAPAHLARALTFLASAATPDRWPHLTGYVEEILRTDPLLALDAGGAALTALAAAELGTEVLEAIEERLPPGSHTDLDTGIAALVHGLAVRRLPRTRDPLARARELDRLGGRLGFAGRHAEALERTQEALETWRSLVAADPRTYETGLAGALTDLGIRLARVGRREEAVAPAQEAVRICRHVAETAASEADDSAEARTDADDGLATALNELGIRLSEVGRREEAVTAATEAVAIRRRLASTNPEAYEEGLAAALNNLGSFLSRAGHRNETLEIGQEVLAIQRRLAAEDRAAHEPQLATALSNLGIHLWEAHRMDEAHVLTREAVAIRRRLADVNPAAYESHLADALANLGAHLAGAGFLEDAVPPTAEAVAIQRRLARANPAAYEPDLAWTLSNLGAHLYEVQRLPDALAAGREAVEVLRRLVGVNPAAHEQDLASGLGNLGVYLIRAGRPEEAAEASGESVAILGRLAAGNPALHEPELLRTWWTIADEHKNQRPHAALEAAEQAVRLCRRLVAAEPDTYATDLRIVLTAQADVLRILGRAEEADVIVRELDDELL
ncbi:tetratricopeptide repeat protein [Streptomyces sp. NPDC048511]|uniref:tetratricopeptide repeat protein n=1 Tax=Streptomyces sp. NPDC048511 TaxID=3365562 RepID=UPI0037234C45